MNELPTIKGELAKIEASLRYDLSFSSMPKERVITLCFNEITELYDKTLLAHEQRAIKEYEHAKDDWEDTFDRWDKFREEELEPLLEDAGLLDKFADLYDELVTDAFGMNCLKGELDKIQALKGEVKKE